jgi:diacylglycerol kinase (ATP)
MTGGGDAAASAEVAVLVNPSAGRGRHASAVAAALAVLRRTGRPVRVLEAATAAEAEQACVDAVRAGAGALITVGGDGTLHLGLQAVAATPVAFGVIPAGTGNDFAVEVGMPRGVEAAAQRLAAALLAGRTHRMDLGLVDGPGGYRRWFGSVLSAGFDSLVNERANAMRWPKGPRRYDAGILIETLKLRPRHYSVTLDDRTLELKAILVSIGNTASYGGGLRICPAADPTDGQFDIVIGAPMSRLTLVRLKPRLAAGTHVEHRVVTSYRASKVSLAAEGIVSYIDGERGCPLPLTVTCVPDALTVLGDPPAERSRPRGRA